MSSKRSHNKNNRRNKSRSDNSLTPVYLGIIIFLAIGIVFLLIVPKPQNKVHDNYAEHITNDIELEKNVVVIASKFLCGCNKCQDMSLEKCACTFARRERDFIRTSLYEGKEIDIIVADVAVKYGGLITNVINASPVE
jgi:cytochrome c-type biogenesis protein CcmH/NrfF